VAAMHPTRTRRVSGLLLALSVLCAAAAGVPVAKASQHGCCHDAPISSRAPVQPCQALLALSCCQTTALPSSPHDADRVDASIALAPAAPALALAALAPARIAAPAPEPASSPRRLSVVLRL